MRQQQESTSYYSNFAQSVLVRGISQYHTSTTAVKDRIQATGPTSQAPGPRSSAQLRREIEARSIYFVGREKKKAPTQTASNIYCCFKIEQGTLYATLLL